MASNKSSKLPLQAISSSKLNKKDTTDKKRKREEISDDDENDEIEVPIKKHRAPRGQWVHISEIMMMSDRERERTEIYRKKSDAWTQKEVLALLYLVDNLGTSWREMEITYAEHFQNRTREDLRGKYSRLKKQNNFETLQDKAKFFNEVTLVKAIEHSYKWTDEELKYLFIGVERFGTSWSHILETYKSHFNHRSADCLNQKYRGLEKNPDRFEYFQEQASLYIDN